MDTQLQQIVTQSGLEKTKAQVILDKFQGYFQIAAEWETKAKSIVVKDSRQVAEMQMARTGRLFLREKRITIEKTRKALKEQSLREGKAIDGIANVLKALIVPIEKYLESQEMFVQLKKEAEEAQRRQEVERRMEEERVAKEKADAEAQAEEEERIRKENERLRKEAEETDRQIQAERKRHEAALASEREQAQKEKDAAAGVKKAAEETARRAATAAAEQVRVAQEENERLATTLKNQIECPFCHKRFRLEKGESDES